MMGVVKTLILIPGARHFILLSHLKNQNWPNVNQINDFFHILYFCFIFVLVIPQEKRTIVQVFAIVHINLRSVKLSFDLLFLFVSLFAVCLLLWFDHGFCFSKTFITRNFSQLADLSQSQCFSLPPKKH